ncbi:MAG: alpha-galactosidase [Clostridia bacterium]|nr:alpha-galactosidase [Clostridia bacterium]
MITLSTTARINGMQWNLSENRLPTLLATAQDEHGTEGYVYRKLSLKNPGKENSPQISEIVTLGVELPCKDTAVFHSLNGDNRTQNSFLPYNRSLQVGDCFTFEPFEGRSSDTSAFPIFDLTLDGHPFLFAVGYTGQWKAEIARTETAVTVQIGHGYADFYLLPGEDVQLPSALVMEGQPNEDTASLRRRFRRVLATDFNPLPAHMDYPPLSIQQYDRYKRTPQWDMWVSYEGQLRSVEKAAACKYIDTYWLDAAWFPGRFPHGVGNYSYTEALSKGLKPIADAAHERDMHFMVWFEPERARAGTETFEQHPEFLLSAKSIGEEDSFLYKLDDRLVNLGREDAYQYVYENVSRLLRENHIDYYRQDFNMRPMRYWVENDEPGRLGINELKHIRNLYRLWDSLKEEFPGLFIDNCSSGGRRLDLEALRRAVPMWRSDVTCRPVSETEHSDVWNQNITLSLSEYLPYHCTGAWVPIANQMRAAATIAVGVDYDVLNEEFDFARAQTALAEVVRLRKYHKGDFYPLSSPTLNEDVFISYQFALDGDGVVYVFRRVDCKETVHTVKLQSIDREATYLLRISDEDYAVREEQVRGADLLCGYSIELPLPQSSAVIEYRKL